MAGTKPYQLSSATQSASTNHAGSVTANYDAAGNLLTMHVVRTATGCVGGNCSTSYDYQWDEVGRLTRARRKEAAIYTADLRYAYDATDRRTQRPARWGPAPRTPPTFSTPSSYVAVHTTAPQRRWI